MTFRISYVNDHAGFSSAAGVGVRINHRRLPTGWLIELSLQEIRQGPPESCPGACCSCCVTECCCLRKPATL